MGGIEGSYTILLPTEGGIYVPWGTPRTGHREEGGPTTIRNSVVVKNSESEKMTDLVPYRDRRTRMIHGATRGKGRGSPLERVMVQTNMAFKD